MITRRTLFTCACCAAITGRLRAQASHDPDLPNALELGTTPMQRIAPSVWVARIAPGVWLHSCTSLIGDGLMYPANGLLVERPGGAVLIDMGYRPDQAAVLLAWAARTGRPVTLGVSTHFHADRTGGVPALRAAGIRSVASAATCALARSHGLPMPEPIDFSGDVCRIDEALELYYPGAAHTPDNIVAWLPRQRVLMGGCMVKSVTSGTLGYVTDAVIAEWPASLHRVRTRYAGAGIVVPGHGTISADPVAATGRLLAKASKS